MHGDPARPRAASPKNVNAKAISLEDAPRGYAEFDEGAATKYVLNPNGYLDGAKAAYS